jgi:hypothetical protein
VPPEEFARDDSARLNQQKGRAGSVKQAVPAEKEEYREHGVWQKSAPL